MIVSLEMDNTENIRHHCPFWEREIYFGFYWFITKGIPEPYQGGPECNPWGVDYEVGELK